MLRTTEGTVQQGTVIRGANVVVIDFQNGRVGRNARNDRGVCTIVVGRCSWRATTIKANLADAPHTITGMTVKD